MKINLTESYNTVQGDCQYVASKKTEGLRIENYTKLPKGSESELESAVSYVGPISIAIHASLPSFAFYKSGIYYEPKCNPSKIDHAVLLVGYGSENGKKYWIIKKSYGEGWGGKRLSYIR